MCLERLTVRNGSMIRNIFGLFSCKNQGKNGYFPVMYSNKRTGYAKDKNLRNSKKKKKEGHGIGLENVRYVVEKHQGDMEIISTDHEFQIRLFLYMNLGE